MEYAWSRVYFISSFICFIPAFIPIFNYSAPDGCQLLVYPGIEDTALYWASADGVPVRVGVEWNAELDAMPPSAIRSIYLTAAKSVWRLIP